MASLIHDPDGRKRIEFTLSKNGVRHTIRLGRIDKRSAEAIHGRIEHIISLKVVGAPLDAESVHWLGALPSKLYGRLVKASLATARAEAVPHRLGELLERFMGAMTVKAATSTFYSHTRRNLADYFGADKPLNAITEMDADSFKAWLKQHESLSTATANRRTVAAKTIFRLARRWGMMAGNPFDGVRGGGSENESRKRFITRADVAKVLEVCPNVQWRVLVALSRFGGLRIPSEALPLTWADVDWDAGTLHVTSPKTEHHAGQGSRTAPLFPELRAILLEAYEQAEPGGSPYIITRYRTNEANLRTHFARIIRRAGLEPWPKPWHNMRASLQSELMRQYDLSTACRWLGNSPTVAARHYAVSTDTDAFRRAAGLTEKSAVKSDVKSDVEPAGISVPSRATVLANHSVSSDIRGEAHSCTLEHIDKLGGEGLEPPASAV